MASSYALAENWQPLTGAERLQSFVSGATVEIQLTDGVIAVGTYRADGTATIEAWNEAFQRTWEVRGDEQVCYITEEQRSNCFTYEQNLDDPLEFRSRNVATGEVVVFRVMDEDTKQFARENTPGSDGGVGAPSASEIAAQLSDPNTNLGSMNFQIDYINYDGDLPADKVGTRFALLTVRTFYDAGDPDDLAKAHAARDRIAFSGGGSGPLETPDWDLDDLAKARKSLSDLATLGFENTYAFGSKGEVRPIDHLVATAAGWNYVVRMYQPREEILDGSWTFPEIERLN